MKVDRDLLEVLTAAARARRTTSGAFDMAVEPLMRVWGFREARKAAPGAMELREAEKAVRASVVMIDGDRVTLPSAVTQLDLGGIGVGYGLDRAASVLRRALGNGAAAQSNLDFPLNEGSHCRRCPFYKDLCPAR